MIDSTSEAVVLTSNVHGKIALLFIYQILECIHLSSAALFICLPYKGILGKEAIHRHQVLLSCLTKHAATSLTSGKYYCTDALLLTSEIVEI
jgi:hypothetical protein